MGVVFFGPVFGLMFFVGFFIVHPNDWLSAVIVGVGAAEIFTPLYGVLGPLAFVGTELSPRVEKDPKDPPRVGSA